MRYLLLILITLFIASCTEDPQEDKCKESNCAEWQACNRANGLCVTKAGFCSGNGECSGINTYCNEDLHKCINHCENVSCEEWQECNIANGHCDTKAGFCIVNNDCLGENEYCYTSEHACKKKENPCDGETCSKHGTCGADKNTPKCVCDNGYFNKDSLTCLKVTCINIDSPVGHTEAEATDTKEAPFIKSESNAWKLFTNLQGDSLKLCKGSEDIYTFSGKYPIIRLTNDYIIVKFYENSIKEENLIKYDKREESSDEYYYNINNPSEKQIFMVISSDKTFDVRYSVEYLESCNNDYCTDDYSCNSEGRCIIDCSEHICPDGLICNSDNICEFFTCESDFQCGDEKYCLNGECKGVGYCNENSNCDILNTTERVFECMGTWRGCNPITNIDFGESVTVKAPNRFGTIYLKLNTTEKLLSFDLTVNNIDGIDGIHERSISVYHKDTSDYYLFYDNNSDRLISTSEINFNVNYIYNPLDINYLIALNIGFETCINDCKDVNPTITLSQNDNSGCTNGTICETKAPSAVNTKCDEITKGCIRDTTESIAGIGEECSSYENCIIPQGEDRTNYFCDGKCVQMFCENDNECNPTANNNDTYCFKYKLDFLFSDCLEACTVDNDCPIYQGDYGFELTTCSAGRCIHEE